jgi:hypothetical protein
MRIFQVRYSFLEPKEATVRTNNARNAAISFLNGNGGKSGNFGRCVQVMDVTTKEIYHYAFIRTSHSLGYLKLIDSKGFYV